MRSIRLACGQLVCSPGDLAGQVSQVETLSVAAAGQGARLILFGEAALTGYRIAPDEIACTVGVGDAPVKAIRAISREHDIVIAVGAFEAAVGRAYISQFVIFPDGRITTQRKHRLSAAEREAGFTAGPKTRKMFMVDGVRFAVAICADSGIPGLRNIMARQGVQVYLHPCAGGAGREHSCQADDLENPAREKSYLTAMEKVCFVGSGMAIARRHRMALVTANLSGDDNFDHFHPGHSLITDSRGCLVALQPGEYVKEFLRPLFIMGDVVVQKPRTVATD